MNKRIYVVKPSEIEDICCNDIFPDYMLNNMMTFLKKDIDEALRCLEYEFWTPTVLMSARILESQLKKHIYSDLGIEDDFQSIGECLRVFRDNNYPQEFITLIDGLREIRNLAMHGEKRFGSNEAIEIFKKVLVIVAWIYNIPLG